MAGRPIVPPRGDAESDKVVRMQSRSRAAQFRRNARDCAMLAARARSETDRGRILTMEKAWLALADNEDWLEGAQKPQQSAATGLSRSN